MSTVSIAGEFNIYSAAEHKASLLTALADSDELVVDLDQVTELDTAGLQVLFLLKREANLIGKPLHLARPSQAVLDVLALTNTAGTLRVGAAADEAEVRS